MNEQTIRVAKAIYEARLKRAWGSHWVHKNVWPDFADPKVMRAYPHNPIADVDLAFASAEAAINAILAETR